MTLYEGRVLPQLRRRGAGRKTVVSAATVTFSAQQMTAGPLGVPER